MTLLSHLTHPRPGRPAELFSVRARATAAAADTDRSPAAERVYAVQLLGAISVGGFLLLFGLLGFTRGLPFLSTSGERLLGLSSNGLLSALSVLVAGLLLGAALRGPRVASTVMIVLGGLFLLSAVVNTLLVGTTLNLLAFRVSNVVFSLLVGSVLLVLGAYGRICSNLPADSPYAHREAPVREPSELPATPEEVAAEAAMRAAEIAVVEHRATEEQQRRVRAMATVHTRAERRRVWMDLEDATSGALPR